MCRLIPPAILLSSLMISACSTSTPWPEHGKGGMAEHYLDTELPIEVGYHFTSVQALRMDMNHSQRHLDILVMRGANSCFPAAVAIAEMREKRISREVFGGLYQDAANDLLLQREALNRIEQNLNAITPLTGCNLQQQSTAALSDNSLATDNSTSTLDDAQLASLYQLLNSDNQFAVGSDRINPKYARNLQLACSTLNEHKDITLKVTGHTDASGNPDHNNHLSHSRARSVVTFLINCQVDENRIELVFEGQYSPLFNGRSPEIDLVNRRVSILPQRIVNGV